MTEDLFETISLFRRADQLHEFRRMTHHAVFEGVALEPISSANAVILDIVCKQAPISMSDVARISHKTRANVSAGIKALEKQGLVQRTADSFDGRMVKVSPTEKGLAYVPYFDTVRKRMQAIAYQHVTARELKSLANILGKISRNIDGAHL